MYPGLGSVSIYHYKNACTKYVAAERDLGGLFWIGYTSGWQEE